MGASSYSKAEKPANFASKPIASWILYDWAAQPFFTLITTFLFAPYFANTFIGDAVKGQAYWGYGAATAGVLVAILSPICGAVADATGRKKPWIAFFSILFVVGMVALWLAEPGTESRLLIVLLAFVLAVISAELGIVFTNSMMPSLVPQNQLGRLSGYGWAVGYAGGLISLILMAGLVVVDPQSGKTILGLDPILNLDHQAHEGDRLVGPFCAVWYAIFVLPLFLFTPDGAATGRDLPAAVRDGLGALRQTFINLSEYKNIILFLIARMIYQDGLGAVFAFGGIYAASVFGWSAFELGIFGIVLSISAAIGAFIGGAFDDRFGARTVILIALIGLLLASIGILSIDKTHIFFAIEVVDLAQDGGTFSTTGERLYLVLGILIGLVAGPLQASSRSMLVRIAPLDKVTEFFGLYAFSGKITSFAAPLIIATVTVFTQSQRLGIATITIFFVVGLVLIWNVKEER